MEGVYQRSLLFLTALFNKTAEAVEIICAESHSHSHEDIALSFRSRMTDRQSAQHCNEYRTKFYEDVIRRAKMVSRCFSCTLYLPSYVVAGGVCHA